MDKSDRDRSGYQFSTQAANMLDGIEFTPEGAERFFRALSRKSGVELPRFRARFFIVNGTIRIPYYGQIKTAGYGRLRIPDYGGDDPLPL